MLKAKAWAKPSQSQAGSGSFGLAWALTKPKLPQARPKPGLSGQAGPCTALVESAWLITCPLLFPINPSLIVLQCPIFQTVALDWRIPCDDIMEFCCTLRPNTKLSLWQNTCSNFLSCVLFASKYHQGEIILWVQFSNKTLWCHCNLWNINLSVTLAWLGSYPI